MKLYQVLSDIDLSVYYELDAYEHHECLVRGNTGDFVCKPELGNRGASGQTYAQYMVSQCEYRAFCHVQQSSCAISVNRQYGYITLARILGISLKDMQMYSSVFFWRLFKRLYYNQYKKPIPPCVFKAVAHLNKQYNRHPSMYESLVCSLWSVNHNQPLIGRLFEWDKPLFTFSQDQLLVEVYEPGSQSVVWSFPETVRVPSHRRVKCETWFNRVGRVERANQLIAEMEADDVQQTYHQMERQMWEDQTNEFDDDLHLFSSDDEGCNTRLVMRAYYPWNWKDGERWKLYRDSKGRLNSIGVRHAWYHDLCEISVDAAMNRWCCHKAFWRKRDYNRSLNQDYLDYMRENFIFPSQYMSSNESAFTHIMQRCVDMRHGFYHEPCERCEFLLRMRRWQQAAEHLRTTLGVDDAGDLRYFPDRHFFNLFQRMEPQMFRMMPDKVNTMLEEKVDIMAKTIDDFSEFGDTLRNNQDQINMTVSDLAGTIKQLKDTVSALCTVISPERFDSIFQEIEDGARMVFNRMGIRSEEEVTRVAQTTCSGIDRFFKNLSIDTHAIQNLMGRKVLIFTEIVCLWFIHEYVPSWLFYTLLTFRLCMWFGLHHKVMDVALWLYSLIPTQFREEVVTDECLEPGVVFTEMESQGSLDTGAKLLATAVFGVIFTSVHKVMPKKDNVEGFLKSFDAVFRINRGLEHIPKFIEKLTSFIEKTFGYVFGVKSEAERLREELRKIEPRLVDWAERVSTLFREGSKLQLECDEELRNEILQLRDEANKYAIVFSSKEFPRELLTAFHVAYKEAIELGNRADHAKVYKMYRYAPFCVWFAGSPRIGKSHVCMHLGKKMTKNIGLPLTNCIYSRCATDHWDAYTRNPVVYIDDAGQNRGDFEEKMWNEFISMGSNAPLIPPQADLADKGRIFDSKVIICSSNITHPDTNKVALRDAILARRHLVYQTYLLPEFRKKSNGQPDKIKINDARKKHPGEFPHLRFAKVSPTDIYAAVPFQGTLTYKQVLKEILEEQKVHDQIQKELIEEFESDFVEEISDDEDDPLEGPSGVQMKRQMKSECDEEEEEFFDLDSPADYVRRDSVSGAVYFGPSRELQDYTSKLHSRISEMKKAGYSIPSKPLEILDVPEGELRDWLRDRNFFSNRNGYYRYTLNDLKFLKDFTNDPFKRCVVQVKGTYADNEFCEWAEEVIADMPEPIRSMWYQLTYDKCKVIRNEFMGQLKRVCGYDYLKDSLQWYWTNTKGAVEKIADWFKEHVDAEFLMKALKFSAMMAGVLTLGYGLWKLKQMKDKNESASVILMGSPPNMYPVNRFKMQELDEKGKEKYIEEHIREFERSRFEGTYDLWLASVEREHIKCDQEMGVSGDQRTSRAARVKVVSKGKTEMQTLQLDEEKIRKEQIKLEAQSAEDQNAIEMRNHMVIPHMYRLSCTSGGQIRSVIGLAMNGRNLLMPYHFVDGMVDGTVIKAQGPMVTISFAFDSEKCFRLDPEIDAAVIVDIARLPVARKLSNKFVREKDLSSMKKLNGELVVQTTVSEASHYVIYGTEIQSLDTRMEVFYHDMPSGQFCYVREGFIHAAPTRKGDCGGVLVAHGGSYGRKLLGIHVNGYGGGKNGGVCCLITEEMLDAKLKDYTFEQMEPQQGFIAINNNFWDMDGNKYDSTFLPEGYIEYGKVAPQNAVFSPCKTDIKPSLLYDRVREHVTEPAVLSTWDDRNVQRISPFQKALKKYTVRTLPFPPKLRRVVKDRIRSIHELHVKPLRYNIGEVNLDMAINGLDIDHYDVLNMDSSPGFPWTKQRPSGAEGKKFLFDELHKFGERSNYRAKPVLVRAILDRLELMRSRKLPFSVWVHCLKDERRALGKIADVNTRIFTMAPVDLTILGRMLTMDFVAAFIAGNTNFYSAVGIDPYSPQWSKLYMRHRRVGKRGGDGDYSKYDGILDPDLIDDSMDLIADWYDLHAPKGTWIDIYGFLTFISPEERRMLLKMFGMEFVCTWQLVLDILHQKVQGNPSGNWLTVILNSIVGEFLLMLCYLMLAEDFEKWDFYSTEAYVKNVMDAVFGDDNQFTATEEVLEFFNPDTLSKKLAEHNITYTAADKLSGSSLKNLDDFRFLKCGFQPHPVYPEKKMANLDVDSIYELTNWIRKCPDELEQLQVQCSDALRFAYYHGYRFYDKFRISLNQAIREAEIPMEQFPNEWDLLNTVFLDKFY